MPKRILRGTVSSSAADKTITVVVERLEKHPILGKVMRKSKKFTAHDEKNTYKQGDVVRIQECRPISKRKSWVVLSPKDKSQKAS